jgi:hypothetical protein
MPTIEEEVEKYVEQGYFPEEVTSRSARLIKYKHFSGLWALAWYLAPTIFLFPVLSLTLDERASEGTPELAVPLLLGFFTLAIYCAYFAMKADWRVHIFYNTSGDIWVREEQVRSSIGDYEVRNRLNKLDRIIENKPRRKTSRKVRR